MSAGAQIPGWYDLKFSHEIEQQVAAGDLSVNSAAYNYTYIGDYVQAVNSDDINVSWGLDTMYVEEIEFVDAVDYIKEVVGDHRIVIISESHMKPQHRIFSSIVIMALYENGFRHLGIEALTPPYMEDQLLMDTALNERGYPLFSPITGTYTKEPQMASLIRSSITQGYTIFGYERGEKIPGKDRDEIQADNVIRYLEANTDAKVILHCGWYHAIESRTEKYKNKEIFWLAHILKQKTGIDPLTIYQDNFTEKIARTEHDILSNLKIKTPSIAFEKEGEVIRWSDNVDIEVFHPKTKYINGRPDWLYKDESHKAFKIDADTIDIAYPLFAKAYLTNEGPMAVPIDIIEIKSKHDNRSLVLPKGKYLLVLDNRKERQHIEIQVD